VTFATSRMFAELSF